MKSLKKTLVLLVVLSMILTTLVPAFAATDVAGADCEEEVARMEALGIIKGYEDGTFKPENTITRAEMAVIICKMVGISEATVAGNANVASKFSDVKAGSWYAGYVNVAAGRGLISGFPDGTFRPDETLTMNHVLTLCVNALGRGEYVATMGTWPANYISEAAKLGLTDGVKTSDANRGNVAIIAWNTLNAPVWDVTSTEYNGTISLSENEKTLLGIHFRNFTVLKNVAGSDFEKGDFKETDDNVIVASTPSRKAEIGDRQIVLALSDGEKFADVYKAFDFLTNPKSSTKETKTYVSGDNVVAYVPESVYPDLESLRGNKVTVVFGEDNVVALIIVEDDVVDNEFIAKYDSSARKITVGETTYKLLAADENIDITLNDETYTTLKAALNAAGVADADFKDIEKRIQVSLTLNDDSKVESIGLFASATIADVSTEAIVTKVKETSKEYKIYTTEGEISWELDEEDDIDFPRVYIDGTKGDIRDIEAGNVLTVIGESLDIEKDITTIYVSTKTVAGEATKVKKANNAITIDGTVYTATKFDVEMTEEKLSDDKWNTFKSETILDNDEVTLYLNILGEYVGVSVEEGGASDYTFGVVTYVSNSVTWEGDEEEILVKNIKVLLADGSKKTFKVKVDTSDDDAKEFENEVEGLAIESEFIMFKASADSVINIEDGSELVIIEDDGDLASAVEAEIDADDFDYDFAVLDDGADKVDGREFKLVGGASATYTSKTVIFNKKSDDEEIVKSWNSIVDGNKIKAGASAYAVFDEDDEDALYIIVTLDSYASSDAEYAIVDSKLEQISSTKYEIDFVDKTGVAVKNDNELVGYLADLRDWFIKYTMSSDKVDSAKKLIDLDEFNDLDDEDIVTVGAHNSAGVIVVDPNETDAPIYHLANSLKGVYTKEHLKVEEVLVDDDYAAIKYADDVESAERVFALGIFYTFDEEDNEYTLATTYNSAATYYTATFTLIEDEEAKAEEDVSYYSKDGNVYTLETVEVGTTVVDGFYEADIDEVDADEFEADTTLGKIRLDDDNLVVLDLRDGSVVKTTLEDLVDESNFYAVLYKDADCATGREANVVVILD